MRALTVALSALLVLQTASAQAQQVSIDLRDGNVTLVAKDATLDDILAEWSKVGGLKVVSVKGEGIGGGPLTMVLRDMSEQQALETLLRGLSGYILSARHDLATGSSAFEQILILPTSSPAPSPAGASTPGIRPLNPTLSFVAPGITRADRDRVVSIGVPEEPPAGLPAAESGSAADSSGAPPIDAAERPPTPLLPPSTAPDANNPFGRAQGSSRPGVMTPAGPPPGVFYPPVTNPNPTGAGFKPAGTP